MEEVDPFSEGTDDSLVSYDKIIRVQILANTWTEKAKLAFSLGRKTQGRGSGRLNKKGKKENVV